MMQGIVTLNKKETKMRANSRPGETYQYVGQPGKLMLRYKIS